MSAFLSAAGVLVAALASAAAVLLPPGRARSAVMVVALVLFPVLILGDQWHSHQIVDLRHSSGKLAALLAVGAVAVVALAAVFRRWPVLLPLAIVAVLPFRVPLHSGGDTANLLVPLYLVIAGGVLAVAVRDWSSPLPSRGRRHGPVLWLPRLLAAAVVLYALQSFYSDDFSKALQNSCFFLVPFTVAYALLADVEWDRRLLSWTLILVALEAVAFVLIGSVEYLSRSLFWNDAVIRSNEFHTYFRVNSVFWDPNIYGRYLALALVVVTTALLWVKDRRPFWLLTGAILVLWIGLAQTFSQSSFVALLGGLAVLAALRWSWRWTLAAVVVGVIGATLVVLLIGGKSVKLSDLPKRINIDTSGRGDLVSGGLELWSERPLGGYGSGSFQQAYREHRADQKAPVTISHTEPVTILAEQGVVGLALYLGLIVVALWTMGAGMWARAPGGEPTVLDAARAAVLATFVALLLHTLAYAG
ncbi:MAG: O-antigen ligase family protein, partial [Actinobacteria bacterium]|nr:O-antigen ligase family protein [Actinomycetota bacterium]